MIRCERCALDGLLVTADLVLKQRDAAITLMPRIGLCRRHYEGLERIYRDLGWRKKR